MNELPKAIMMLALILMLWAIQTALTGINTTLKRLVPATTVEAKN